MEILPSEYQNIELSRYEKMFVRHAISNDGYGFLLLKVNPTMIENESMNVLISSRGVVFFKFFEDFSDASLFGATMQPYTQFVYPTAKKIISEKLLGNKSLSENAKALKFPINIVHVFPNLKRADISKMSVSAILDFVQKQCLFSEDFSELRQGFGAIIDRVLDNPIVPVSDTPMLISDLNVNSVMQRIAPEYVTVRVACVDTADSTPGVDSELLVVDEKDVVVRAFRLDKEQINIINRISKDDPNQLILACAGSGKSVLLISKCFKAAQMNPNKKFLITCRNENLHSLYTWFIDRAGLREKNVECMTFHTLCKKLLEKNGFTAKYGDFDGWVSSVIDKLNRGQIQDRYYGIFIDEVQALANSIVGVHPEIHNYNKPSQAVKALSLIVNRLVQKEFVPTESVVIVSDVPYANSILAGEQRIGAYNLVFKVKAVTADFMLVNGVPRPDVTSNCQTGGIGIHLKVLLLGSFLLLLLLRDHGNRNNLIAQLNKLLRHFEVVRELLHLLYGQRAEAFASRMQLISPSPSRS